MHKIFFSLALLAQIPLKSYALPNAKSWTRPWNLCKAVLIQERIWYICTIFDRIWYLCTIFGTNMVQNMYHIRSGINPKTAETYMVHQDSCTIFGRIWYRRVPYSFLYQILSDIRQLFEKYHANFILTKRVILFTVDVN